MSYDEAEDLLDDEDYEGALDKFSESILLSPVKVERVQNKGKMDHFWRRKCNQQDQSNTDKTVVKPKFGVIGDDQKLCEMTTD